MKHLVNEQSVTPSYLLMAGRGYQNDKARFYSISSQNPTTYYNKNLVPAIGVPGADALFSFNINHAIFFMFTTIHSFSTLTIKECTFLTSLFLTPINHLYYYHKIKA